MRAKPVHWSEGMLVLPHHFQAAEASLRDSMATLIDWRTPYSYGIRRIEWTPEALENFELRVRRLQLRMKDGTIVSVPENAHLADLDLRTAFAHASESYIFVAVPEVVEGRANASRRKDENGVRSLVEPQDWADRNAAGNPRPIDTEMLNARLVAMPTREGPKGTECLPIMKLKRSAGADALPEVDEEYIPPLLACDAWQGLKEDILAAIVSQLGSFGQSQGEYIHNHGGFTEANQPQIRKALFQLFSVNTGYTYLRQLTEAVGVHPFVAYTELCRMVGSLSLFRTDWRPPELPLYDHDDLGRIFRAVKMHLQFETPAEKVRIFPFIGVDDGVDQWMEVALEPQWIRNQRLGFYIGVKSDLTPERLEQFFKRKFLETKVGSSRTIKQIFRQGEAGLEIERVVGVHQSLPARKDYTYFEIKNIGLYWDQVAESRTLALMVNKLWLRGSVAGQNILPTVDPRGNPHDLRLELYMVDNE